MNGRIHYHLGFTVGGLFLHEGRHLARLLLELGDLAALRERILAENLLQVRTLSSLKRLCRECVGRLAHFQENELRFLTSASQRESGYLLWLAACRHYPFLTDFALEVLDERFMTLQPCLPVSAFMIFFQDKALFHPELERLSSTTLRKVRQVVFRMLREASLLDTADNILPAIPGSEEMTEILLRRREYLLFPMDTPRQTDAS